VVGEIKLLIDEDVHSVLSSILRKRGFDAVHVQELNRKGRSDIEQLTFASRKQRALLSFNVKDYVLLHNKYVHEGKNHSGIIVSKQITLTLNLTLKRVLRHLQDNTQSQSQSKTMIKNRILFLSTYA